MYHALAPDDFALSDVFATSRMVLACGAVDVSEADAGAELHVLGFLGAVALGAIQLPCPIPFSGSTYSHRLDLLASASGNRFPVGDNRIIQQDFL